MINLKHLCFAHVIIFHWTPRSASLFRQSGWLGNLCPMECSHQKSLTGYSYYSVWKDLTTLTIKLQLAIIILRAVFLRLELYFINLFPFINLITIPWDSVFFFRLRMWEPEKISKDTPSHTTIQWSFQGIGNQLSYSTVYFLSTRPHCSMNNPSLLKFHKEWSGIFQVEEGRENM